VSISAPLAYLGRNQPAVHQQGEELAAEAEAEDGLRNAVDRRRAGLGPLFLTDRFS
jgi:hypothetical protein